YVAFGNTGELPWREHRDGPAIERDPLAPDPDPELLVDGLAGRAEHLAHFMLRHVNIAPSCRSAGDVCMRLGEPQQQARKPSRQVQKDDLLQVLAGGPEPRA